jgi:hypothetical protein
VQIIDRYFGNFSAVFAFKGDVVTAHFNKAAEAFLNQPPVPEDDESGNPLLVLFEALKWSFRISCHLVIGFLEDTHSPQKKGDM